jgi:hypothetical protein
MGSPSRTRGLAAGCAGRYCPRMSSHAPLAPASPSLRSSSSTSPLPFVSSGPAWIFSPTLDVLAFGGSVFLVVCLLVVAAAAGDLPLSARVQEVPTPEWTWVATVLLIDVAHVWGTAVLIYLDPVERRRRPLLYGLVPLGVVLLGTALASESELLFWRVLAYLAVWHFVRQQVGFLRLYRGRAKEHGGGGQWIDEGTVYATTLCPLVWWHAHVPTTFHWFVEHDFVAGLPVIVGDAALAVAALFLACYVLRAASTSAQRRQVGKHLFVATTTLCWFLGIVWWRNDLVFTVTNVVSHGVPYVVLVCWTARRRQARELSVSSVARAGTVAIVGVLWIFAVVEEVSWDVLVHHERPWLRWLPAIEAGAWRPLLVALLSVPQVTHYVLDAVYWKRRDHPDLASSS